MLFLNPLKKSQIPNSHRYRVKLFYVALDMQLQELSNCFNEVNIKFLLCLAFLWPNGSFVDFDK